MLYTELWALWHLIPKHSSFKGRLYLHQGFLLLTLILLASGCKESTPNYFGKLTSDWLMNQHSCYWLVSSLSLPDTTDEGIAQPLHREASYQRKTEASYRGNLNLLWLTRYKSVKFHLAMIWNATIPTRGSDLKISLQRYLNNPTDMYYRKMFSLLPKTPVLAPRNKKKKLTHVEQLEQHTFRVQWVGLQLDCTVAISYMSAVRLLCDARHDTWKHHHPREWKEIQRHLMFSGFELISAFAWYILYMAAVIIHFTITCQPHVYLYHGTLYIPDV